MSRERISTNLLYGEYYDTIEAPSRSSGAGLLLLDFISAANADACRSADSPRCTSPTDRTGPDLASTLAGILVKKTCWIPTRPRWVVSSLNADISRVSQSAAPAPVLRTDWDQPPGASSGLLGSIGTCLICIGLGRWQSSEVSLRVQTGRQATLR